MKYQFVIMLNPEANPYPGQDNYTIQADGISFGTALIRFWEGTDDKNGKLIKAITNNAVLVIDAMELPQSNMPSTLSPFG